MEPLFSLIVPVYNVEKYLGVCLESLLQQDMNDFEIVIVNDGSIDKSVEIANRYVEKDKRIKVVHKENGGLSSARNEGIKVAKGEYILFIDSDDWCEKNLLSTLKEHLEKKKYDIIIYKWSRVDETSFKKGTIKGLFPNEYVFDENNKKEIYLELLNGSNLNSVCIKAIKSELIKKHNIFFQEQLRHTEDLVFSAIIISYADSILYLDQALYNYRYNPNSLTTSFNLSKYNYKIEANLILKRYVEEWNLDKEIASEYFYRRIIKGTIEDIINLSTYKKISMNKQMKYIKNILKNKTFNEAIYHIKYLEGDIIQIIIFYLLKLKLSILILIATRILHLNLYSKMRNLSKIIFNKKLY